MSKPTRLFHAVVVVGSALTVPALTVGAVALATLSAPGCRLDHAYTGIGIDIGVYNGIDIGGYVDIGVPRDMAPPIEDGGDDL